MLEVKMFEVRDRMTFIPVVAVLMESVGPHADAFAAEAYLLRRAGYAPGSGLVSLFSALSSGGPCHYDPYGWNPNTRTMKAAHQYIGTNWATLTSGDVIDVEFILGESAQPKVSERA